MNIHISDVNFNSQFSQKLNGHNIHSPHRHQRMYFESTERESRNGISTYTNDSESLSAVIKEKVDYKKHQWPIFNDKMKQLVDQSQQEVKKAIIGTGRYQMKEQYRHLIVDQKSGFE